MPRVRSVRISKNMIITLSTGLGIHREEMAKYEMFNKTSKIFRIVYILYA